MKNDAVLRFIINDTGIGMSEEFLPHILSRLPRSPSGTTALYGGTGLGMAISKSIVDMMDGKITVRSIKGIGTEFTVDVKLGITEEEKPRQIRKKQNFNFSHLKTLVVDDDAAVCESAAVTLHEMGIKAEWVDSGRGRRQNQGARPKGPIMIWSSLTGRCRDGRDRDGETDPPDRGAGCHDHYYDGL